VTVGIQTVDDGGRLKFEGTVTPGVQVISSNPGVACETDDRGRFKCEGRGLAPGTVTFTEG
jgi:hypothetical protein